jgi:hypothetical protein
MSHITDPPAHWRERAAEMRSIANAMPSLVGAQEALLQIAEQYELKALQAEGKEKGAATAEHDNGASPHTNEIEAALFSDAAWKSLSAGWPEVIATTTASGAGSPPRRQSANALRANTR